MTQPKIMKNMRSKQIQLSNKSIDISIEVKNISQ